LELGQGIYSDIADQGTIGKKFLRGYQLTDNNGTAKFTTIYPGWYQGRAIHIHDKVRTFNGSEKTLEWTSQLYFDNSINEQVHKQPPYSKHGPPDMTNEQDGIYAGPSTDGLFQSNTGKHLMVNLTKGQGQSYIGVFNIVLNATQQKA
jgi:protocatechuate 3,4-dioxygenase beta subunit